MPSLLTHHLLGRRVLTQNGWSYPAGSDECDAFTMGCQGPDPFFFAPKLDQPTKYIRFGQLLHSVHVTACFDTMRRYMERQSGKERSVLKAYPVSYTHLDVYKRQIIIRFIILCPSRTGNDLFSQFFRQCLGETPKASTSFIKSALQTLWQNKTAPLVLTMGVCMNPN